MLSLVRLAARNAAYHWRGNLAVLLGVAVGSAVLTGALLVGDSLRGSLRAKAERQLGRVDAAALFPRPVRLAVADGLPGTTAPVLLLAGSIQTAATDAPDPDAKVVPHVTVLGIDRRFGPAVADVPADWAPDQRWTDTDPPVVLSARVAARLGVSVGARVRLGVPRFSELPRSSSLAQRGAADVTATKAFIVAGVLPPDAVANDFNLTPNPAAPLNVFVPLSALWQYVRDPADRSREPKITAVLATGATSGELNAALRDRLAPEDYGIRLQPRTDYLSVESTELVLTPAAVTAIEASARELGLRAEPTIVYVADTLAAGKQDLPYPIIAGLNPAAAPPLGPFLPKGVPDLKDDEILLVQWRGHHLPLDGLPPGSAITMTYYDPDVEGEGKVRTAELRLRGYLPLAGAANDPYLTPEVRGVTDRRASLYDWDRPPMLPRERVKARLPDKHPRAEFWNEKKATPMAYVNLATAEKYFTGRRGAVTSVRIAPAANEETEDTAKRLAPVLLKHLDASDAGLTFDSTRERLLTASRGGTDFGGLFLAFSMFLIAAALMLVGLLFRLSLDRRAKEVGLLLATGYRVRVVRRLLLAEGLGLAVVGTLLGLVAAVGYNRLLLAVLLGLWPDPDVASFLKPHATATSFALGAGLTVVMCLGALWLSVRGLVKVPPPALLRGETTVAPLTTKRRSRFGWVVVAAGVVLGVAAIAAGGFVGNPDYQAMTFFAGGGLLLTAGLTALLVWLKRDRHDPVTGRGVPALARLGGRNAARNPGRSLLTAALLASAAFLLVAVESFRRQPGAGFLDKHGGSGGFNLLAQTDAPVYQSFGDPLGRADLEKQLRDAYTPPDAPPNAPPDPRFVAAKAALDSGLEEVIPLRLRGGDDASCMNLFQATRPRILGVPDELITRGGFQFYETEASTPEERANPWLLLKRPLPDGVVPVFAENNTAVWMLKTAVGGEVTMPDDAGGQIRLRIVGTLADSPFQSELLMADSQFTRLFPQQSGYRMFLIRTPPADTAAVSHALEVGLRANGLTVTPTREKVAEYQKVIGAYLSTFQLLGGFGLLLGVFGLAVVVLRGVWERLGELALLRAVGYRTRALQFLVLAENALLLVAGLGIGVLAALASVAPHVAGGAAVPWLELAAMLLLVLVTGLGVASAATAGILRVPVIPALRRE